MKVLIYLFFLIIIPHSWTKADDISNFKLEDISIGDSLLDYFNLKELNNKKKIFYPGSRKFFQLNFKNKGNFEIYDQLQILIKKNDKKFHVYEFSGSIYYRSNINECYKKEKEVISDIRKFTNPDDEESYPKSKHSGDETGMSTKTVTQFYFNTGGVIKVSCFDWSKYMEEKGDTDSLRISIASEEAFNWFVNEAYK